LPSAPTFPRLHTGGPKQRTATSAGTPGSGLVAGIRAPRRISATAGVVLAIAGGALAGCGSSGSATGDVDPATLVPASAKLYANIAIEPSATATSTIKQLTHQAEPYGAIAQSLLSSGGSHLQFKQDIKPWIGSHAGVFVTSIGANGLPKSAASAQGLLETVLTGGLSSLASNVFGADGAQGAIVLDTSDAKKASAFISKRAQEQSAHSAGYRGVTYQVSSSGTAEGIVRGLAVIGSESGIKSVIDTSLGAPPIATASGYSKAPTSAIASVYLKPEELGAAIQKQGGHAASEGIALLGKLFAGASTASIAVTSTSSSLSLAGEIHSTSASTPLFGPQGAQALGQFPGGAWLAAGVGDTGVNLTHALGLLQAVASLGTSTVFASIGGESIEKLFEVINSPSAKLRQDFGRWAGPGGIFVSGTGLFNLESALVIDSKDPAASSAAVGKLASLMRKAGATVSSASVAGADQAMSVRLTGFPAVLYVASGSKKFVIGLGEASVLGALNPSSTLSSSSSYASASSTLGGGIKPSLIVEFPALLAFLEGVGLSQSTTVSSFVPYFKTLGVLTAGASTQGDTQHFRLVLGLSSSSAESEESTG
jgi:hypothetical protein